MKIAKITLAVLASFVMTAVTLAGELTVTGNAKATYSTRGSDSTTAASHGGKGIGIANEFTLSASGETDNGIAWKYAQDIDGATVQDDASLTLTIADFGTIGIMVSEGGISSKYGWNPAVYAAGSDYGWAGGSTKHDGGSAGAGYTYGDDIGGWNNIQYHTPAGILPFGIGAKVAFAPSTGSGENASSDATGAAATAEDGDGAVQYQINAAPIDGLSVTASYFEKKKPQSTRKVKYESGGASAKYSMGPVTVGYGKFYVQPSYLKEGTDIVKDYTNTALGIAFNVNENFSVSYTSEKSEANKMTAVLAATAADTRSTVETKINAIQAAYTMGGMTISVADKSIDNLDYTAAKDGSETVVAISLAF